MKALEDRLIAWSRAHGLTAALACAVVLLVIHGPHQSFMAFDEGYYAAQARMMLHSGDWMTQRWWSYVTFDRAMGANWLIAASQSVFGIGEIASRLPSMIASLLACALVYAIGLRLADRVAAVAAAAILAVTPVWMQASKLAAQDVPLVMVELFGIWCLLRAEDGPRRWIWAALAGSAVGLGFAIKSFMILPAAAALLPYLIWDHRRHRHLTNPAIYIGFLVGLLPTIAWLWAGYAQYGAYVFDNFFGKFTQLAAEDFHGEGPFFYLWNVPATAFPWAFLGIAGAVWVWPAKGVGRKTLLIGAPLTLLILLTVFPTRTWYYGLQLHPYIALLAAIFLVGTARRYRDGVGRAPMAMSVALGAVGALLLIAGCVLLVRPALITPAAPVAYVVLGLLAGAGLLAPVAVLLRDRRTGGRAPALWAASWLAGPFLGIAVLFASGLWGDYRATLRGELAEPALAAVLSVETVDMVQPVDVDEPTYKDWIAVTFHTPNPGIFYADPAEVPPGAVAWMNDAAVATLGGGGGPEVLGRAGRWMLVRLGGP